ncbi:MAG: DUF1499 domain-containing protein [Parvularculaceae bacterium]|nr:DUF1499 domain-containing protein [Parvularculaceae bacterium]
MTIIRVLLLTLSLVGFTASGAFANDGDVPEPTIMIDFKTLQKTPKPNQWLVAPDGLLEQETADAPAPTFSHDSSALFVAVSAFVKDLPRTSEIKADPEGMSISYVATVPVFGFKDDVDITVLSADGGSTLAVYSRSRVGYSDFGVNKRRVDGLLEAITAKLGN